jgi:hypothetical protein
MLCSDDANDRSLEVSSQGWVFGGKIETILATGSGPTDGDPSTMSSYTGIVAVLYIIYRICQAYNINSGKAILYCDNKGTVQNVHHKQYSGITPYFNTNHDLVEIAQCLLCACPLVITGEWVKGNYMGKYRTFAYGLNDAAYLQATAYQNKQERCFSTTSYPPAPPGYKVWLLH